MKTNSNDKNIVILAILILIVAAFLGVLVVYGHPFSKTNKPKKEENTNNNVNKPTVQADTLLTSEEIASLNIYGTYYNKDYQDLYFSLNENNEAVLVESSCSNGALPAKVVSYKVLKTSEGIYILVLYYSQDDDEVGAIELTYEYKIDSETSAGYFVSLNSTCTEEEGQTLFQIK